MIIGLGHRSGHGKDTVAGYMVEWLEYMRPELRVKRISMAWKMKQIAHELYKQFGLQEPEFYETEAGRQLRNVKLGMIDLTPVEIWVKLGQGIRDRVWHNTWVSYLYNLLDVDVLIIPDVRHFNELEICNVRVKVHNPFVPDREGASIDHVLADYAGWDHIITNDQGFSELRGKVNMLCNELFKETK